MNSLAVSVRLRRLEDSRGTAGLRVTSKDRRICVLIVRKDGRSSTATATPAAEWMHTPKRKEVKHKKQDLYLESPSKVAHSGVMLSPFVNDPVDTLQTH